MVHTALRRLCRIAIDEEIECLRGDLRWVLNPSDFMQDTVFWLGTCDIWKIYHLKRYLEEGCVIFDVGANFGYYSLVLSSSLHHRCTVHAFEPNPPTFKRLKRKYSTQRTIEH